MTKKDNILGLLPQLSQAELKEVVALVNSLIKPSAKAPQSSADSLLLQAMNSALGVQFKPVGRCKAPYNEGAPLALAYLGQHYSKAMGHKVSALALLGYMLRLIIDDLQRMQVPVGPVTVAQSLHKVPKLFRDAFPGYSEGLASWLIEAKILGGLK